MKKLEIIYFVNQNKIEPFLKIEETGNKEYYQIKEFLKKYPISEQEKEYERIRIARYIKFLNDGFSYNEMYQQLCEAQEKLINRGSINGIEEVFDEKEALKIANHQYQNGSSNKKLLKKLNRN